MHKYIIQGEKELALNICYEVDLHSQPLGAGGMGQVFKGVRIDKGSGIRKDVAVKFLYQDLPTSAIRRSKQEASIQIQNENLIEMMGFIEMEEVNKYGVEVVRSFVVSELLHGVMLYDLLQGKTTDSNGEPITYAEELYAMLCNNRTEFAKTIVMKILAGVMALHDNGYIHRDIDPSNIMITDDRKIKLIDFGIAKEVDTSFSKTQDLTRTGSIVGKPSYAAPEIISGDIVAHNYSTDLYQIGILLYELMVGARPFIGSDHEIMVMQLNDDVPVENINHDGIAKIIAKATKKKQCDRYRSAAEFRVDLENCDTYDIDVPYNPNKNKAIWVGIYVILAILGILLGWHI